MEIIVCRLRSLQLESRNSIFILSSFAEFVGSSDNVYEGFAFLVCRVVNAPLQHIGKDLLFAGHTILEGLFLTLIICIAYVFMTSLPIFVR